MIDDKDVIFCGAYLANCFERLFASKQELQDIIDGKKPISDIIDSEYYSNTPNLKTVTCTISLFGFEVTGSHFGVPSSNKELAKEDACNKALGLIAFVIKYLEYLYPSKISLKDNFVKHSDEVKAAREKSKQKYKSVFTIFSAEDL